MSNYWVVGASWGGTEHQDQKFVNGGYWMLGWEAKDQPNQYALAATIKPGDRIAIKRMKGKGHTGIKILHIGIIKDVILDTNKVICTVNWVVTDLQRDIADSKGCFKSIHGPFAKNAWVEKVFCL